MKVSVVTPIYNTRPEYVKNCIDSILAQDCQDFQIIAVNDGSDKYSYDFLKDRDKILYIENEKNLGISKSVNIAYSHCNSDYIVRVDSDDYILPNFLSTEIKFLDNNPEYIAVCMDLKRFGDNRRIIRRPKNWTMEGAARGEDYGFAVSMMFRSHVLKHISTDEDFTICEDFDFHVKLLNFGKIEVLHKFLYLYRKHSEQVTETIPDEERIRLYNIVVERAKKYLEDKK